ncbi:interferon-induced transmembrane protein 1-like [Arapaima gigas]
MLLLGAQENVKLLGTRTTESCGSAADTMEGARANVSDHLGWSIFTTLCCCLPLGVAAIVCSFKARNATSIGDSTGAQKASRTAKILNIVGLVVGLILIIIVIVVRVVASKNQKT